MLDVVPDTYVMEDLNAFPGISSEDVDKKTSSGESLTPRTPLLTPRTSQIGLLLSGQRTIAELENSHQVCNCVKLLFFIIHLGLGFIFLRTYFGYLCQFGTCRYLFQ
jgi:hypothetical protein